jgi:hypothetical protein
VSARDTEAAGHEQLALPLAVPAAVRRRRHRRALPPRRERWQQLALALDAEADSVPSGSIDYRSALRPPFMAAALVDVCHGVAAARRFTAEIDDALAVLESRELS